MHAGQAERALRPEKVLGESFQGWHLEALGLACAEMVVTKEHR